MLNAYLIVTLLVVINLINYMDRFTIAGVLNDIQTYFDINDATGGLLQTSFIVSYMIFSPLFGYLGDRYSRKYIILFGVSFWSTMTFLSSFVQPHHTYLFFMFRALVGIGEASYATVAPTLIADLFIGGKRSTMLAVFYFAIPVGSGLGYIVGILMSQMFGHWTWALRFTPIFGIISVFGFLFVTEPARGAIEQANLRRSELDSNNDNTTRSFRLIIESLTKDVRYLTSIPTYLLTTLGFTCVCFSVGAVSWWAPTFMQNANPDTAKEKIGLIFGVIACLGGLSGVLIGYSCSRYFRSKFPAADSWVCAIGVAISIPCTVLSIAFANQSPTISWLAIFLAVTFLSTNWSVVVDILLYVIIPQRRSTAQSLQILTSHILGDASSPFIIGAISDAFSSDFDKFHSLSYALYLTPLVLVFGVLFFGLSARFILKDEHRCKQMISNGSAESSTNSDSNSDDTANHQDERRVPFLQSESSHNLIHNNVTNTSLHQRSMP
ncbi:protein spinster homolog 1 isoform X2 [Dermatophagoides farinae]|uniref:protein spinster homolog 1 isoform X2 n=1 Tax=Dermatophagoides farinae TaxID=6954 RepID=UPI001F102E26|nr:protein spinster homolog 1-like isoform X2 [Dermatophagoides farinae]